MARARFTEDFDYRPTYSFLIAYKAGREYPNMKREAVDQAVAAGKAVEIKAGRKAQEPSPSETEGADGDQAISG